MVIACLGRDAHGIASTYPSIDKQTLVDRLITRSSQQGTHLSRSAQSCDGRIVGIVRVDKLWTYVETRQATLFVASKEVLVSISHGEAQRIVLKLIESGTYDTATNLCRLMIIEERSALWHYHNVRQL